MVQIEHRTPSNYYNRHRDWYHGTFRDVVHQIGLIGEYLFWLDCNGKAQFIDSLNPFQDTFPFENIEQWMKNVFKRQYANNYIYVYDEWCLEACKFFEKIEGQVSDLVSRINSEIANAKSYIQRNFIDPLKDRINNEIMPKVNDVVNRIRTAETTIRDAQNQVNEALSDVANLKNAVVDLNTQVNNVRGKFNHVFNEFNTKIDDLNNRLSIADADLASHTDNIKELFERVNALEQRSKEQTDLLEWLRSLVPT